MNVDVERDIHQKIMNVAYDKWDDKQTMGDWFDKLLPIEKKAVALGKLNQQVCNGGFAQWFDNGYSGVMFDVVKYAINIMPKTETVEELKRILIKFENVMENNNWGEGSYTEMEDESCYTCDGTGETFDDDEDDYVTCDECDGSGTVECEVQYFHSDEVFDDLRNLGIDDEFYKINEQFLIECELFLRKLTPKSN